LLVRQGTRLVALELQPLIAGDVMLDRGLAVVPAVCRCGVILST
jgi:hypothetical protein